MTEYSFWQQAFARPVIRHILDYKEDGLKWASQLVGEEMARDVYKVCLIIDGMDPYTAGELADLIMI